METVHEYLEIVADLVKIKLGLVREALVDLHGEREIIGDFLSQACTITYSQNIEADDENEAAHDFLEHLDLLADFSINDVEVILIK